MLFYLGYFSFTTLLVRIESKAVQLIGDLALTSTFCPLSLHIKVASVTLFYWYYFGHCFDELEACIPLPMAQVHVRHNLPRGIV